MAQRFNSYKTVQRGYPEQGLLGFNNGPFKLADAATEDFDEMMIAAAMLIKRSRRQRICSVARRGGFAAEKDS